MSESDAVSLGARVDAALAELHASVAAFEARIKALEDAQALPAPDVWTAPDDGRFIPRPTHPTDQMIRQTEEQL